MLQIIEYYRHSDSAHKMTASAVTRKDMRVSNSLVSCCMSSSDNQSPPGHCKPKSGGSSLYCTFFSQHLLRNSQGSKEQPKPTSQ